MKRTDEVQRALPDADFAALTSNMAHRLCEKKKVCLATVRRVAGQ